MGLLQSLKNRQDIAILMGSQAAIKTFSSYQANSKLAGECLNRVNMLDSLNIIWILSFLGHVGLEGNLHNGRVSQEKSRNAATQI